ncbi:MAG: ribosome biogenesis GTPase Der [Chloroflexota bacterium]
MDLVAIVGRPNVGKSTLFNRLTETRQAIVEDTPGVTRDRIYGEAEWNGKRFMLIDTGGFIPGTEDKMERAIREQAEIAIREADVIMFITDGRDGVTPFDEDIATALRRSKKPIVLVVNKCDNVKQQDWRNEFFALGLGDPYAISAMSGHNSGDMLDAVAELVKSTADEEEDERLKIAFLGRPNSGKSSLTNSLLGYERSIVTDIPGTTRDAVDSVVKYYGEEIVLIDTAGLRRRSQVKENIEMFSILRTQRAIARCDVGVLLVDATRGLEDQDKKIINQIEAARKGMIIAVNKWDLVEKETMTSENFKKKILEDLKTLDYVPIVFISALTKQRITKVLEMSKQILESRRTKIKTSELNEALIEALERTPPPSVRGRDLRINYITQIGTEPPVFAFFCNYPELLPDSYKRFIERQFRKIWNFTGTPVSFVFRRKNVRWEDKER